MSAVTLLKVVHCILNSGGLNSYEEISDLLDIHRPQVESVFQSFRVRNATPYDVFKTIIDEWAKNQRDEDRTIGNFQTLLRQNQAFTGLADSLQCLGDDSTRIPFVPTDKPGSNEEDVTYEHFELNKPTESFVGRDSQLEQLLSLYNQEKSRAILYGMGGQGKTELCRKFLQNLRNSDPKILVSWFAGDSAQQLISSIARLQELLKIPKKAEAKNQKIEDILKQISYKYKKHRWIAVLDNVDEEYPEFAKIVKSFSNFSRFVLITTRRTNLFPGEPGRIHLGGLLDVDAWKLVGDVLNTVTQSEIKELCRIFGNHALALRQAISYISTQKVNILNYEIADFVQEFNCNHDKVLLQELELDSYEGNMFILLKQTLTKISVSESELSETLDRLMKVLSVVSPMGVQFGLLRNMMAAPVREENINSSLPILGTEDVNPIGTGSNNISNNSVESTLLVLRKYSLIEYDNNVIIVHRVVQKIGRMLWSLNTTLTPLLAHMSKNIKCQHWLDHTLWFWHLAVLDVTTAKDNARIAFRIFKTMRNMSSAQELQTFGSESCEFMKREMGKYHIESLKMSYSVAIAMSEMGRYEQALERLKHIEKYCIISSNPDYVKLSDRVENGIAYLYIVMGRGKEVLKVLKRRLEDVIGDEQNELYFKHKIAVTLSSLGRDDEALPLLREILTKMYASKNYDSSDPKILLLRINIANCLMDQERSAEAEIELEDILGRVKFWEADEVKALLAICKTNLNKPKEGIRLMKQVSKSWRKKFGADCPITKDTEGCITHWRVLEWMSRPPYIQFSSYRVSMTPILIVASIVILEHYLASLLDGILGYKTSSLAHIITGVLMWPISICFHNIMKRLKSMDGICCVLFTASFVIGVVWAFTRACMTFIIYLFSQFCSAI